MTKSRPRVLLIAEAANPEWVSVPLIGWSLARALSDVADVHLVTQVRNTEALLRAGLVEGQDFTAIDNEAFAKPIWAIADAVRMGWTMKTAMNTFSYKYFEHLVWQKFGTAIQQKHFDIVHRITPVTPTAVSPIASKCQKAGVPFVLGPLNGGIPWPKWFSAERRREGEWLSYVRGIYKASPGRKRMLNAASAILVGSRHTESEIPARYSSKVIYLPENAIDPKKFGDVAEQSTEGPLRAVFVGRLVPLKGVDMAIEAAAPLLVTGRMTYDIIGDGPVRADLEKLVAEKSLGDAVTFHGQLPHDAVQSKLTDANILLFPSIKEFGGGVVLESLALGVIPLVVDYGGPAELITPQTGMSVPIGPRDVIIPALRSHLTALAEDKSALPRMGAIARNRIQKDFTWSAKAAQISEIYDWVSSGRGAAPRHFE